MAPPGFATSVGPYSAMKPDASMSEFLVMALRSRRRVPHHAQPSAFSLMNGTLGPERTDRVNLVAQKLPGPILMICNESPEQESSTAYDGVCEEEDEVNVMDFWHEVMKQFQEEGLTVVP